MARKTYDLKAEFTKLLAPRILKAVKDHRRGTAPLRPAQRKACMAMLRIVMTAPEIKAALAKGQPKAVRRRARRARR